MKSSLHLLASLALAATAASAHADPATWTTWSSAIGGTNGSAAGRLNFADGSSIGVAYRGEVAFWASPQAQSYWTAPAGTYTSAAIDNGPSSGGMVALSRTTSKTLTFSAAIDNLFFAITNLDGNGYEFDRDFTIESNGPGAYGNGTLRKVVTPEGRFRLMGDGASHGTIRFDDTLSSITWASWANDHWSGFTVGTYGVSAVPEPATWCLMAAGFLGMALRVGARRRSTPVPA